MLFPRIAAAAFALAFAGPALADDPPRVAVRATIEAVADGGSTLAVRMRSGETQTLKLAPAGGVTLVVPASLADIKPGLFVGAAALPGDNGEQKALEVHIFPEAQRGTGEGFHTFDLAPGSTMTNGAIEAKIDGVDGPKLTVTYKGGKQTIVLDKTTAIVAFAPGERSDLKKGAAIVARATKAPDGSFEATRILVGKDGLTPPM
jgi:Domain of unknown function (DUF5666)